MLAKKNHMDYSVDLYPHYGSDASSYQNTGNDTKVTLIGPGVHASTEWSTHTWGLEKYLKISRKLSEYLVFSVYISIDFCI